LPSERKEIKYISNDRGRRGRKEERGRKRGRQGKGNGGGRGRESNQ